MTRYYENRGLSRRMNLSTIALVAIALYGVWELWAAAQAAGESSMGYMFGIAFVGGAAYGLRQIISDSRDVITHFDVDPASGRSVATLWRPFGSQTLDAQLDRLRWRFHIKLGKRSARTFFLYVDHPVYPNPLQFELRHDLPITADLRRLAGEAIDEFERAVGMKKDEPEAPEE